MSELFPYGLNRTAVGTWQCQEWSFECTYGETHHYGPWLNGYWPVGKTLNGVGCTYSQHYSNDTSGDAKHDGFDEELIENIHTPCANTHSQTDFSCSFSDADLHDVHDTDTTDNQWYSSHATEQYCEHIGGGSHHWCKFLLRANHSLSEDAHLCTAFDVVVGEHHSVWHVQLANGEIIGIDAINGGRSILIAIYKLSAFGDSGTDESMCLPYLSVPLPSSTLPVSIQLINVLFS